MEGRVNEDISVNMANTADTQKIVIYAEENADNVYWKDGKPVIDDDPDSFANAARNWAEANTKIAYQKPVIGPDGVQTGTETAYKPSEIMIVVGYGKNQITKAFNDVKSSKFVDDDTKLIIMGHAGATFGGEDAGSWGNIMKDTEMRDKFSQVAYGACAQGESANLCGDLSRSFGPKTEVFAQVGQAWGAGSTYNIYTTMDYKSGQARGPDFTTDHQPPKEWQEQVFTVGSGYVKFHADYGGAELIDPGWGNYKLDKGGFTLEEADAFVGAHQDPALLEQYRLEQSSYSTPSPEFEKSYLQDNPDIDPVTWEDRPKYPPRAGKYQDDWSTMKSKVMLDLQKEYWAETHDGEELPEKYLWSKETIQWSGGKVGANLPREDEDAFYDWYDAKAEEAEASGEMTYTAEQVAAGELEYYHGSRNYVGPGEPTTVNDYAGFLGNKRLLEQRALPLTSEEVRIQEEYDFAKGEWDTAYSAYHSGLLEEYQSGLTEPVAPPYIGGEHMLDLEDNIPYSLKEMVKDPTLAVNTLVNDESGKLAMGIHKLGDLYDSGNEAAIAAYQEAYKKMQDSGMPEYELRADGENSAAFNNLLHIEALRAYALSGTGEQYRSE